MGSYNEVQHEDFPELGNTDLALYKGLSDALRNFEFVTIYNFMDKAPEDREAFVAEIIEKLDDASERVLMMNCGPLCPRGRSCIMCRILAPAPSNQVSSK